MLSTPGRPLPGAGAHLLPAAGAQATLKSPPVRRAQLWARAEASSLLRRVVLAPGHDSSPAREHLRRWGQLEASPFRRPAAKADRVLRALRTLMRLRIVQDTSQPPALRTGRVR